MGGPREKFRNRPRKSGAKRKQKVRAQKRRLVKAGVDESVVEKMTSREVRDTHREVLN